MKSKYEKGRQGYAEDVANRNFVIAASVIYVLVVLCFVAFNTYAHDCFKRASGFSNISGLLMVAVSYFMVYNSHAQILPSQKGHWYWIAVVGLLAIGLSLSCGFNFDLTQR